MAVQCGLWSDHLITWPELPVPPANQQDWYMDWMGAGFRVGVGPFIRMGRSGGTQLHSFPEDASMCWGCRLSDRPSCHREIELSAPRPCKAEEMKSFHHTEIIFGIVIFFFLSLVLASYSHLHCPWVGRPATDLVLKLFKKYFFFTCAVLQFWKVRHHSGVLLPFWVSPDLCAAFREEVSLLQCQISFFPESAAGG